MDDPEGRLATHAHCVAIQIEFAVSADKFDPGAIMKLLPTDSDLAVRPVGLGLRFERIHHQWFSLTALASLHQASPDPHYHIIVRGTAVPNKKGTQRGKITAKRFSKAIARGVRDPTTGIDVIAEHEFPRELWKGMALPVPLPSYAGDPRIQADLSGVEVSFKSDVGPEIVLVSSRGDIFAVFTSFVRVGGVEENMFENSLARSMDIAGRLFNSAKKDVP